MSTQNTCTQSGISTKKHPILSHTNTQTHAHMKRKVEKEKHKADKIKHKKQFFLYHKYILFQLYKYAPYNYTNLYLARCFWKIPFGQHSCKKNQNINVFPTTFLDINKNTDFNVHIENKKKIMKRQYLLW